MAGRTRPGARGRAGALVSVADEFSIQLREERGDLWDEFSAWPDDGRRRVGGAAAGAAEFERDCAGVAGMITGIGGAEDLARTRAELGRLRNKHAGQA
jgi:hypothetical protein